MHGLLAAVAFPGQSMGFSGMRFSGCGTWAQLLRGMWNLPGLGIKPVPPTLADGLPTTGPPRMSFLKYSFGLSRGTWDLIPGPGIKPRPPPLGAWSLSHWTIKEVLPVCFLLLFPYLFKGIL